MRKLIVALILAFSLTACTSTSKIPEVAFKGTTVEDLVDYPNPSLMQPTPPAKKLEKGTSDGVALSVMTENNARSLEIENNLSSLQQYVCNMFKKPAGEVCKK